MCKRFLSLVLVPTIITGFTQNQIFPNKVEAIRGIDSPHIGKIITSTETNLNETEISLTESQATLQRDSATTAKVIVQSNAAPADARAIIHVGVPTEGGGGGVVTFPPIFPCAMYPTGLNPVSLAAADLNGDSRPDLVVANQLSNTVSVLPNLVMVQGSSLTFTTQLSHSRNSNIPNRFPLELQS